MAFKKRSMPIQNTMMQKMQSRFFLVVLKFINPEAYSILGKIVHDRLSYLSAAELFDIWRWIHEIERDNLTGVLIETGCALGGSAIAISAAKSISRPFYVYDTYGLIPPPSVHDGSDAHERYQEIASGKAKGIQGDPYYGYQQDLIERVRGNFEQYGFDLKDHNIHLIEGFFVETLVVSQPVAFAHIDVDWYESVKICLERIEPMLVPHGVLVIDDYSSWSGCRKAVDEFFRGKNGGYLFRNKRALHVIKQ